ncbi:hypothetical protein CPB86DRAFT_119302 [Serendipita vermifera]|nr:hypothetical protein CPB86DRAFT_119302 [Serendipita vermifera]
MDPTLLTGPLLLGHLFNLFLYGIEILQVYLYHTSFPNDRPWTRRLVGLVLLLDTLQTCFAMHNAWKILGSGWGDQNMLLNPEWSWGSVPLFTGLVSFLVQGFYAYRILKLIQSKFAKYIVALVVILSITQCVCGVTSGVYYAMASFKGTKHRVTAITTVWLGGTALCDLVISATIVTFLLIKISGFKPTDNVVTKVIKMTVEIGAITTSAASADLILFLLFPGNNLHLIFCIPLAKLYSNTLLAMLNARKGSFLQNETKQSDMETLPTIINIRQPVPQYDKSSKRKSTSSSFRSPSPTGSIGTLRLSGDFRDTKAQATVAMTRATPISILKKPTPAFQPSVPMVTLPTTDSAPKSTSTRLPRPTKSQANADFDDQLPSHLDLTVDESFRKRFMNKFR